MGNGQKFIFSEYNGKGEFAKSDLAVKPKKKEEGFVTGIVKDIRNMKENQRLAQEEAERKKLEAARREYEHAAIQTGIKEEQINAKQMTMETKSREMDLNQKEKEMGKAGDETYWDVKERVRRSKQGEIAGI